MGIDFAFEFLLQAFVNKVFDTVGRLVDVVKRHAKMLDQVGFPKSV